MNLGIAVMVGAALGWVAYAMLAPYERWGIYISVLIGAVGGFLGGNTVVLMFGYSSESAAGFSVVSLVVATCAAAACLAIGNMLATRYKL